MVALGGVEGELSEEPAGGGVDDADVEVLDQDDDAGSGVGSADADGVQLAAVPQGDLASGVDLVASDTVVGAFLGLSGIDIGKVEAVQADVFVRAAGVDRSL